MLMGLGALTDASASEVGGQSSEPVSKKTPNAECDNFMAQANNNVRFVTELSEKLGLIPESMEKEGFADSYRSRISQRSNDCYLDGKKSHMESGKVVYMGHSDISAFGDSQLQAMQNEGHLVSSGAIDGQQGGVFADKRYASSESLEKVKNFGELSCDEKHLIPSKGQLPDSDRGIFTLHLCSNDIPKGFAKDSIVLNKEATNLFLQNSPDLTQKEKDDAWKVMQESLPTVTRGDTGKSFVSGNSGQMQDKSESWFYVDESSNPKNANLCKAVKSLVDSMEPKTQLTDRAKLMDVQYNMHGIEFVEKCQSAVGNLAREDYKNNVDGDDFYYQNMHYTCSNPNAIKSEFLLGLAGPAQDMLPDGTVYVPMKSGEKELAQFKDAVQESMYAKKDAKECSFVQKVSKQSDNLRGARCL